MRILGENGRTAKTGDGTIPLVYINLHLYYCIVSYHDVIVFLKLALLLFNLCFQDIHFVFLTQRNKTFDFVTQALKKHGCSIKRGPFFGGTITRFITNQTISYTVISPDKQEYIDR